MRDEISNAEVDRILQQLRQDQPAAAAAPAAAAPMATEELVPDPDNR